MPEIRLYGIKCVRTGATAMNKGEPMYFSNKADAKKRRDELEEYTGEVYAVILGPDHRKNLTATPAGVGANLGI